MEKLSKFAPSQEDFLRVTVIQGVTVMQGANVYHEETGAQFEGI